MGLRNFFFFLVTSRNNRLDVQTVIPPRDKVHLSALTENSKRAFLMLVMKIQRPKILKWKKKNLLITKKSNKKRQPQA